MKRLAILAIIVCAWFHLTPAHAQFNGCSSFCGTSSSAIADAPGFNNIQNSGGAPALACTYTPVTSGTQNVAYTGATPSASGGVPAYTFSETGALPSGLTISSSTGVISGTPSANGSFPGIQVQVTDTASTVANCGASFTLTIAPPAFQGIGDVVTAASVVAWGSCARVYDAALASTSTSLCDIADVGTGAIACTLRGSSTGFVDLTSSYCAAGTLTPAAFCAAHTSCVVSKIYDQTGNSRPWTQATLANMPGLAFGAVNSLPVITCNGTTSRMDTPAITQAQPFSMDAVFNRTSGTATGMAQGTGSGNVQLGTNNVASQGKVSAGVAVFPSGVTDASYNGLSAVFNNASGAYNVNGTDTTPVTVGTDVFSAATLRFCTDGSSFLLGRIAEGGMWGSALSSVQRGAIYTNQHGSNGYNGAF